VGLDDRSEYSYKIGQLVLLKGSPKLTGVYLWTDPIVTPKEEDPAGYVPIGTLGLIIAVYEGVSCKIIAGDSIGGPIIGI
jgi:hypothetical protein